MIVVKGKSQDISDDGKCIILINAGLVIEINTDPVFFDPEGERKLLRRKDKRTPAALFKAVMGSRVDLPFFIEAAAFSRDILAVSEKNRPYCDEDECGAYDSAADSEKCHFGFVFPFSGVVDFMFDIITHLFNSVKKAAVDLPLPPLFMLFSERSLSLLSNDSCCSYEKCDSTCGTCCCTGLAVLVVVIAAVAAVSAVAVLGVTVLGVAVLAVAVLTVAVLIVIVLSLLNIESGFNDLIVSHCDCNVMSANRESLEVSIEECELQAALSCSELIGSDVLAVNRNAYELTVCLIIVDRAVNGEECIFARALCPVNRFYGI